MGEGVSLRGRMRIRVVCLSVVCGLLARPAAAALIEKIVVFPTAESVRIQAALRSTQNAPGLRVHAQLRPVGGGPVLWEGALQTLSLLAGKPAVVERTIGNLKPRLWSPGSPVLYELTLAAESGGASLDRKTVRTGFRSVESRDGRILLNGRPIFLCGLAINPPGRSVPDATAFTRAFAYDYVRYMRSQNFNCIRMNLEFAADPRAQIWFDVCDELGMMVYQGCYGSPPTGHTDARPAKDSPPKDLNASIAAYEEVFETYARHPSIILYLLANELPYSGRRGDAWHEFLSIAYDKLKRWDATRLYIGNAGYGEGREGDINDVHRYWGWYYNSFLTYYNLRTAQEIFGERGAIQPFTFSECVGSFTGSLGEFNLTFRKQVGAQLHWTGHSPNQAADALAYQAFMAKHACESFRTMRELNPRLAGLMPFTILFYNWNGITRFDQMKPKPVAEAMGAAYQPILLAWEAWTPQVYAGARINAWAHVVNDSEDFSELHDAKLAYQLTDAAGKAVLSGEKVLPAVPYFAHRKVLLAITIPAQTPTGDFTITGAILKEGNTVSRNKTPLFIAGQDWRKSFGRSPAPAKLFLYDPAGATGKALAVIGIEARPASDLARLPSDARLIIGEGALPGQGLAAFVRRGGRVLLLGQDSGGFQGSCLPANVEMLTGSANEPEYVHRKRPTRDQMNINIERPDHPIFSGLDRSRFQLWSDYTEWDQTKPGFPAVYPVTRGFRLTSAADLAHVAILANYDRGLEGVAVCEMFDGAGSVIFTGLDLVKRIGLDPIADRMLANLVAYLSATEHPIHPLIDAPIQWGRYATEKGLITGPLNGLVVNCRWVRPQTDPNARPLPDNEGAWNTLPGDQYIPFGRRPYGPYGYSNGTSTVELNKGSETGSGLFHAALPPGRKAMITRIENPSPKDGRIAIEVNGRKESFTIPAGKTLSVRNALVGGPTTVSVGYTGDKCLVLLETVFE